MIKVIPIPVNANQMVKCKKVFSEGTPPSKNILNEDAAKKVIIK